MSDNTWEDEWDAPSQPTEEDEFFNDDELESIVEGALVGNEPVEQPKKRVIPEKIQEEKHVQQDTLSVHSETLSQTSSTGSTPRRKKKKNPMDDVQVLTPKRKRKRVPNPTLVQDQHDDRSILSSASSGRSSQQSHDEEIVGQRSSSTPSGIIQNEDNYQPPPELNETVKETYNQMIRVFGDYLVRLLCSPQWKHREQGIQELGGDIESGQYRYADSDSVSHFNQMCAFFAKELFKDKVLKVYFCAIELIQFLLSHLQRRYVEPAAIKQMIEPILSTSMENLKHSNNKHTKTTIQFLFWCSQQPAIGIETLEPHAITTITYKGSASSQATYAMNRLNLLVVLINAYGINSDMRVKEEDEFALPDSYFEGFHIPTLLTLALDALSIKSTKARDAAALLITKMYSVCGEQLFTLLSKRLTNEEDVKFLKSKVAEHTDGELQFHFKQKMAFPLLKLKADDQAVVKNVSDSPIRDAVRTFQAKGLCNLLHSKWSKRASVYTLLEEYLSQYIMAKHGHDIADAHINLCDPSHFEQLMQLIVFGLADANPKVVLAAMSLFRLTIHNESIYFSVNIEANVRPHLLIVMESLYASGLGSSNRICRESALQSLLTLCQRPRLGGVDTVSGPLFQKDHVSKNVANRSTKKHLGELSLLHDMVQHNSIDMSNGCFHVDNIMTYVVGSLASKSGDVRESAMSVIIEVYKKVGNVIMAYLSSQKPALMKDLKSKVLQADRVSSVPLNQLAAKLGASTTKTPSTKKKSIKTKILEQSSPSTSFHQFGSQDGFKLGFSSPVSPNPSFGSPSKAKTSRKNRFVFS